MKALPLNCIGTKWKANPVTVAKNSHPNVIATERNGLEPGLGLSSANEELARTTVSDGAVVSGITTCWPQLRQVTVFPMRVLLHLYFLPHAHLTVILDDVLEFMCPQSCRSYLACRETCV